MRGKDMDRGGYRERGESVWMVKGREYCKRTRDRRKGNWKRGIDVKYTDCIIHCIIIREHTWDEIWMINNLA